jgi:heme oxygenase
MRQNDLNLNTVVTAEAELFLRDLRTETGKLHRLLESHPSLGALLQPMVTIDQYVHYLNVMKQVVKVFELHIIPRITAFLPVLQNHSGVSQIDADLLHLSLTGMPGPDYHAYPMPPGNCSVCFMLGFTYVIEGSKLGGKVIFRHLENRLGITPKSGGRYLTNEGLPIMERWKMLLSLLSDYIVQHDGETEAISGATYAFQSINDFFSTQQEYDI